MKRELSAKDHQKLLSTLHKRFEANMQRHKGITWDKVRTRLEKQGEKMWSLWRMEETGGEPDVVGVDKKSGEVIFYDCAEETPKGRRSYCYDRIAFDARKLHKPKNNALDVAAEMGIELLDEEEYKSLQKLGEYDAKTSSWLRTPQEVRENGGAIFGDYRYGRVFIFHNGADSYYAGRGFRGSLRV